MADPDLVEYLRATALRFGARQVCEKLIEEGVAKREIEEALAATGWQPAVARMMVKLAGAAAVVGDRQLAQRLDFSTSSLETFDRILSASAADVVGASEGSRLTGSVDAGRGF